MLGPLDGLVYLFTDRIKEPDLNIRQVITLIHVI
jgi:hypothetical protein